MKDDKQGKVKYPGNREAMDGNTAVVMCERESSDAAGAYPITPSTQMGEYWAEAAAAGHLNTSGRPLIFIEPEGEHAAAAVTAGLSMTGLRSTNFSSGQGIAYMHESLYAAVGKRLTYVLNMGCRAMTKSSLNVHAGHDDYHAVDDTGFFQVFGKNVQEASDLNIISHKIAELSLTPGICAQDGFLTTHLIESVMLPERALIDEYLGKPSDIIDTPTAAQRLMYGDKRRRIPELWTVDNPVMAGTVQNQDAYMQSVASQRPFFFDHVAEITDQCMKEFAELTGRAYERVLTYRCEDAEYLIIGQGSLVPSCEVVADYLRETRGLKVGVVNMIMFRPFPGDLIGPLLKGRKGVTVLERCDQPLAEDLPLIREVRAAVSKCLENGQANGKGLPFPTYDSYKSASDMPPLYSGCYGMGSRDLQPEGVIGTVENMLEDGGQKRLFYLSIDFIHDKPFTPKQEIYQQQILEGYPNIKELSVRGSENPNLMPKDSITARFHSVGGWGAMTTGKNLAMTLFDLLGYHIKANPKYGSEKKGQPTTFYLSAAPEPIRVNCEYVYVDVVLSPDPNVFSHSNALSGLKKGGVFIIQSELDSPEEVWDQQFPPRYQKIVVDNDIKVFYLDGFKIAREIASTPELEFRMQGIAFMGAFFAASPTMEQASLSEERLFKAIEDQLEKKFGAKGRRVVEGNLTTVKRGFSEVQEIKEKKVREQKTEDLRKEATMPVMLKRLPSGDDRITDIHRFWEQTGNFYLTGRGNDNLTDPFIAMSCIPVASGVFRDMTQIRFQHPNWSAEKCTGCGNCWSICPDGAIPGLVNTISDVLETAIARIEGTGKTIKYLRKFPVQIERQARRLMNAGTNSDNANAFLAQATEAVKAEVAVSFPDDEKAPLNEEFDLLKELLGEYKFAITRPFFGLPEKDESGSGGLLSITIDPYTCKGCMECVQVCPEDALSVETQTPATIAALRKNWDFWLALPTTKPDYIRIDDLDEGIGQLETLLLDKDCAKSMVCGDGACLGCGEKTAVRLFVAANAALMAPRVKKQIERIDDLIVRLEKHLRLKLAETVDVSDTDAMFTAIEAMKEHDLTLKNLTSELEKTNITVPIDSDWLGFVTSLLAKLKQLKWNYEEGMTGQGRSTMGMINATGCTSVWGSTYPYNPYPFPWANHLFQDCASMAMGVFEGHMAKMAEGFKAIRMTELELEGAYKPVEHEEYYTYFKWENFTDEEWLLCPPVIAMGGDGALYDIGFQNVSRMLMSGKPIKLFCVDTQVYSNTGGQACTSGFVGQVSDMAQYGKAMKGKEEIRKEFGLLAAMHRTSFVLQGSIANTGHLLENIIKGLNSRRPAVFDVHCPCMPEHGIGDDAAKYQSKLALESRAYPVFTWDPDEGLTPEECLNLDGNPAMDDPWPTYTLSFLDENGKSAKMELPMTFADYAATEYRFRKHFKVVKRDAWDDSMVPVAEYLEMDADDREDAQPYVLAVDRQNRLSRLVVAQPIIRSCEERQEFWTLLKGMAGLGREEPDLGAITAQAKAEAIQQLTAGLMQLAGGSGTVPAAAPAAAAPAPAAPAEATQGETMSNADYAPATIDSQDCTGCGECMLVNPKIFGWNDKKQAVILDPKGGPYKDLVKAAEKCPARVIHPGTPADPNEKGVDKLLKRAAKFNA
jgi:pyruvate-ferredoxin/flavodoxin oxidoreductase